MPGRKSLALFSGLALIIVAAFLFALASGSSGAGLGDAIAALGGTATEPATTLIMELRLPRALTAFAVGGLLAVAGVLMQVLLRNPLAEPYILGTSGGAAVAALVAILLGLSSIWIDTLAFGGALFATLLVFSIAHGSGSFLVSSRLEALLQILRDCGSRRYHRSAVR